MLKVLDAGMKKSLCMEVMIILINKLIKKHFGVIFLGFEYHN
jgi:hypothetical protein